jgi:hypothetical protein
MKVRKAGKGQIFRCGVGHHWPEALLVEGQDPPNINGTYCLPCFGIRIVGRLSIPRADLIADPFGPVEAEPAVAKEETIERAEEVPTQEADPDSREAEGEAGETGESAGEEPAD